MDCKVCDEELDRIINMYPLCRDCSQAILEAQLQSPKLKAYIGAQLEAELDSQ